MAKLAKPVLLYLSGRYKVIDSISEIEDNDKRLSLKATKTVSEILKSNKNAVVFESPFKKKASNNRKMEKISYQVEKEKVDKIKDVLVDRWDIDEQDIDNYKVWIETFNYFFNREC